MIDMNQCDVGREFVMVPKAWNVGGDSVGEMLWVCVLSTREL